jgi:hypothetical protein
MMVAYKYDVGRGTCPYERQEICIGGLVVNKTLDLWLSVLCNAIWIALGIVCFLSALGMVGELLTWWLFGLGLVGGGILGILLTIRGTYTDEAGSSKR